MAGLREAKKERTMSAILTAAGELFTEHGYAGTTTAEIARRAGIAEGTVFNYFQSKAEILVRLVYAVFRAESHHARGEPAEQADLTDRLMDVLDHHLAPAQHVAKSWLREVYAIAFTQGAEGGYVFASLLEMDRIIGQEARSDLESSRKAGLIGAEADLDAFTEIAYSVVMTGFAAYLLADDLSYDQFRDRLRDRLALLVRAILLAPPKRSATGPDPKGALS